MTSQHIILDNIVLTTYQITYQEKRWYWFTKIYFHEKISDHNIRYWCVSVCLSVCLLGSRSVEKKKFEIFFSTLIISISVDIVTNSRPPACDQPRNSNRDRVAHRTDNSVVTLLGLPPETSHGWGFNPTTTQSAVYPREIG